MSVVVRCPGCREASRVAAPVLGLAIRCPGCDSSFVAVEEAELIAPGPGWAAPAPAAQPAPAFRRGPLAPPPEPDDEEYDFEPEHGVESDDDEPAAEPDYDPHRELQGGLPASVLIGLALLPFLIPILWLIATALFPQQPALTVAAPLALAVAASVLCIAVISTIDWSPGTRIRGVLLLVGLSYLTGLGLYFLQKDMVDRVRRFFGIDGAAWAEFAPPGGGYVVRVPSKAVPVPDQPLGLAMLACNQAVHKGILGPYLLVVGSGKPRPPANANDPAPGSDAWFDKAVDDIVGRAPNGQRQGEVQRVEYRKVFPGREFVIKLGDTGSVRVVRVFVIKNRVYYLAVEGPSLDPEEDLVTTFFESLQVLDAAK